MMKVFSIIGIVTLLIIKPVNSDQMIQIEIQHSDNNFVSFSINCYEDVKYVYIKNNSKDEKEKVLITKNEPTLYYFAKKDFIDNHLCFIVEITNRCKIYVYINYFNSVTYLNEKNNRVFYDYYFYSYDKRCHIINKNSPYIQWNNAAEFIESNNYYIDPKNLFNISYYGEISILKSFLVIHGTRTLYPNIDYSIKYRGYIFELDVFKSNNYLYFDLDNQVFYDIKTFNLARFYLDGYKTIDKILLPKNYSENYVDISLNIILNNSFINMATSVYLNDFNNYFSKVSIIENSR